MDWQLAMPLDWLRPSEGNKTFLCVGPLGKGPESVPGAWTGYLESFPYSVFPCPVLQECGALSCLSLKCHSLLTPKWELTSSERRWRRSGWWRGKERTGGETVGMQNKNKKSLMTRVKGEYEKDKWIVEQLKT